MNRLQSLCASGVVLTDGAWATELQKRGLALGEPGDLWNLTRPVAVEAVARSYVEAGSHVILTNTFRANSVALEVLGAADRVDEINRLGVALSRAAADGSAHVFGSIGPLGRVVSPSLASEAFRRQAESLAQAGADALVLETFGDLNEATLAIRQARATGLPVVASFCFFLGDAHDLTCTHATPEQAAHLAREEGADAIGANCGCGPTGFAALGRRLRAVTPDVPLWIKPNAGLPKIEDQRAEYDLTPDAFAAHIPDLLAAGSSFLGACCGAGPSFIRRIAEVLTAERG